MRQRIERDLVSQACDEDIEINAHAKADGGDSVPDPLGTPFKTPLVAIGQPPGESGNNGSIRSPQLAAANGGDSVPDPLDTPVKTSTVAVSQRCGSMLDVCDGTGPIAKTCKSAFPAEGRTRGRRAGRRHPPPECLTQLCGARLLRLISASR